MMRSRTSSSSSSSLLLLSRWFHHTAAVLLLLLVVEHQLLTVAAVTLTEVTQFGGNPGNLRMFIYKPSSANATNAPVLVAPHYCRGQAKDAQSWYKFDTLADKYGFILIYPQSSKTNNCFDVSSPSTLAHNTGGDSLSIVNMVNTVLKTYSADKTRVFVAGFSSGANMANVLTEVYPDVFAAGAVFSGLLAGCVDPSVTSTGVNTTCDSGKITKTGAQWAEMVHAMYPTYTGRYPRMAFYHGDRDEMVNYINFGEEIKAWAALLKVSETPVATDQNTPQSGWTRKRYGSADEHPPLQGTTVAGGSHPITFQAEAVVKFFGLDGSWMPTPETPVEEPKVDLCKTLNGGCDFDNAVCSGGTTAKVTCTCKTGFKSTDGGQICEKDDGGVVEPVEENKCATENGGCDATNAVCSNGAATKVTCTCKSGFTSTDAGVTCVKATGTNKCQVNNGGCDATNAVCSNGAATKVTCTCKSGFSSTDSGVTCVKSSGTNKCQVNNGGCDATNAVCSNGAATKVTCTCKNGFTSSNGGVTCSKATDPTEGACESQPCVQGECVESTNAYSCRCQEGWTGKLCDVAPDGTIDVPAGAGGSSSNSNTSMIIIIIAVIVGVLLLGGLGYFLWRRQQQAQWSTQQKYMPNTTECSPQGQGPYKAAPPTPSPPNKGDWQECRAPDGAVYYFNSRTQESSWQLPQ